MKIQRPKTPTFKNASKPFGDSAAKTAGQVRSGSHHVSFPTGGSAPGFGLAQGARKLTRGKKMY
jgi:hypothetical protein